MVINIDNIIEKIFNTVQSHRTENEGEYSRWLWQDENCSRELGVNEYGCADAVNILYSIGKFPSGATEREKHISALQKMQNSETGMFTERTHNPIHTTAHCIAALELFDAKPLYPLTGLKQYLTDEGIKNMLDALEWADRPWDESHKGAGIYAAATLSDSVDNSWTDTYFKWLWDNSDEETGFICKGRVKAGSAPLFHHLAGTFHYLFNMEYAHRPLRYPEKLIDTCLDLYEQNKTVPNFSQQLGFAEIDWVYCISRASRQTSYRFDDCRRALEKLAREHVEFLESVDEKTHEGFNDLHVLFGTVCCLAELQSALPGMIRSKKPLKLVLDRRPFI